MDDIRVRAPARRPWAASVLAFVFITASTAQASVIVSLVNHGGGTEGPDYGLRVDNGSVQTFDFQDPLGASTVSMRLFTSGLDANTGEIFGSVKHNQSGQLWDLAATLSMHLLTIDGTEWRSDVSGDLYDDVFNDLFNSGDSVFGDGAGNLKQSSFAADRLGFEVVNLTMTLQGGQGPAIFTLDGQTDGIVALFDYPQDPGVIPFMIAKGHRLPTDELAGFGWLDPRAPGDQTDNDGLTQDFLFRVVVPEPSTFVLLGLGFAALALRRRRGRVEPGS